MSVWVPKHLIMLQARTAWLLLGPAVIIAQPTKPSRKTPANNVMIVSQIISLLIPFWHPRARITHSKINAVSRAMNMIGQYFVRCRRGNPLLVCSVQLPLFTTCLILQVCCSSSHLKMVFAANSKSESFKQNKIYLTFKPAGFSWMTARAAHNILVWRQGSGLILRLSPPDVRLSAADRIFHYCWAPALFSLCDASSGHVSVWPQECQISKLVTRSGYAISCLVISI